MSFDLHITRAKNWTDSGPCPILHEEWLAFVRGRKDWRVSRRVSYEVEIKGIAAAPGRAAKRGRVLRQTETAPASRPFTHWMGHPSFPGGVSFLWSDGQVTVSGRTVETADADDPCVSMMLEVARALGARVQGDDGDDLSSTHRRTTRPRPSRSPARKRGVVQRSFERGETIVLDGILLGWWKDYVASEPREWRQARGPTYGGTCYYWKGPPGRKDEIPFEWLGLDESKGDKRLGMISVDGAAVRSTRDPCFKKLVHIAKKTGGRLRAGLSLKRATIFVKATRQWDGSWS